MAYQETTRQSYGSKVKGSFGGILIGIILIIVGTIILWKNESNYVKSERALGAFEKDYVEMPDINTINPEFEGKPIHATGVAATNEVLRDADFGIATNAFRLSRSVEYYQWEERSKSESKDKLGGATETTTTYTYEAGWSDAPVNSTEFKDPDYQGKNFVWRVVEDVDQQAANATFGAYRLTDGMIGSISGEEPIEPSLNEEQKKQLLAKVTDSTVVVTVLGNQVYIGADPDNPHIGDVRITFNQVTSPKTISILQKVVNGTFESFIAKNGKSFSKVEMGTVSAENMFAHQKSANKFLLWMLRILGVILVIAGFRSLLKFISTVFAVVPFVQKIVGAGVGLVTTLIGLAWSLLVIAIAWIAARPALAFTLLGIIVVLVVLLIIRSRKKKASSVAALLVLCLMIGLTGCTGMTARSIHFGGDDDTVVAPEPVKGPVQTVRLTEFYGEGEPYTTVYQYDEKGNVISEETEWYGEDVEDEDYGIIESLCTWDAAGNCTKEVWGSQGVPEITYLYTYDEKGNQVRSESRDAEGNVNYVTTTRYNAQGRVTMTTSVSSNSESISTFDYDEKGNMIRSTYKYNGEPSSTTLYEYDKDGYQNYRKEIYHSSNRVNEYYISRNAEQTENGHHTFEITENGRKLIYSDTTFTDRNGLQHERQFSNYDDTPKTIEGVFNADHNLLHYEYFEGTAAHPSKVVDFNFEKDGVTLKEIVWKTLSLGNVKDTQIRSFAPRYDTFGNWIRRTHGVSYLFDAEYTDFDSIDNLLTLSTREITYRGEDQGRNYGFEGKVGNAGIFLSVTEDDDVFFGKLNVDGNVFRAVGRRNRDNSLYFVALLEEGQIPWSLSIPAGEGKQEATLFDCKHDESLTVTLNPTRKGLKTYRFATTSDEVVGLYRYSFEHPSASGELDVNRCGEDWEEVHFAIENVWNGTSPRMATEEQTEMFSDETQYYIYRWFEDTDTSMEYTIRFFDGFAVVTLVRGNPSDFFPLGTTIAGIYAKLPSVG